jgi:aromatic ring-opening dioxygenase catalytic subunit (LigB family)
MSLPHYPFLPTEIAADPRSRDACLYADMAAALAELEPDVVVAFSPDHLMSFFFDNLPTFAVAIVDSFTGATDGYPRVVAGRTVPSYPALAEAIYVGLLRRDFDPARAEHFAADHSLMVPLQLLRAPDTLRVVPITLNALAPPLPNAARAFAFGRSVAAAVREFPGDAEVLLLANGGINQEVAGPRTAPGSPSGIPDPQWLEHVTDRVRNGAVKQLIEEATPDRILRAGNAAGEMLTLLALLGALDGRRPERFEPVAAIGHAYGFWRLEDG